MKNLLYLFPLLLLAACNSSQPTEAEVLAKISGSYCAEDYTLKLEGDSYRAVKYWLSPMTQKPQRESCKGKFKLVSENNTWAIHFEKDPRPNGINSCKSSQIVWDEAKGFFPDYEKESMADLFDKTEVSKESCEE